MRLSRLAFATRTLLVTLAVLVAIPVIVVAEDSLLDHPRLETGSVGVTIGTPGGFNLNITSVGKAKWGWTFSGGYIGDQNGEHFAGFQAGAVRKLGQSKHHYSGAHFFAGYMDVNADYDEVSAVFIGTGALFKWQVLYGELSFMAGTWDEEWPVVQLGLQIGFALVTFH
jgi:hypothetical protein